MAKPAETAKAAPSIHDIFVEDKDNTLEQAKKYLEEHKEKPQKDLSKGLSEELRSNIKKTITLENINEVIQSLEILKDAKTGIVTAVQAGDPNNPEKSPVLIRDARNCSKPAVRDTESFEIQYLNAIRAAMDIAEHEGKSEELKGTLLAKATDFIERFNNENAKTSQKELQKLVRKEIDDIALSLNQYGIEGAHKKLNVAKEFQGFNDKHCNIVTISSVVANKKAHTVIEAEVGMKQLTAEQKAEYAVIQEHAEFSKAAKKLLAQNEIPEDEPPSRELPKWYNALSDLEKELCKKYVSQIMDGKHVMPTQLRQLSGMKNAFEKITAVQEPTTSELTTLKLTTIHTSYHAGTLASFSKDEAAREAIVNGNALQAKAWIGEKKTLHCNTLNSGPTIGTKQDRTIVKQTLKLQGINITNSALNAFRRFSGANRFDGAKDVLDTLEGGFKDGSIWFNPSFPELKQPETPEDAKAIEIITNHLKPKGLFGRMTRSGDPEDAIKKLEASKHLSTENAMVIRRAIKLREAIESADKPFKLLDLENSSLQVSTALSSLSDSASKSESLFFNEVILTMCASGKDRTGLAEHDQTATALAEKLGVEPKELDGQIIASGHTAQQAGSVFAGGGTPGCSGTKLISSPQSRAKEMDRLMEPSANGNKIKGKDDKKAIENYQVKASTAKTSTAKAPAQEQQKEQTIENPRVNAIRKFLSKKHPPTPPPPSSKKGERERNR